MTFNYLRVITLLSITLLLCSAVSVSVYAQDQSQEQKNETKGAVKKLDLTKISDLYADNVNKKKVSEIAKEIHRSVKEQLITEEDLMYPAIELYGEDSWSNSFNPFGKSKVEVPNEYAIDCTQFSYPLDGIRQVNSHYGYRRRFRRMHYGIDLDLNVGDTVRSIFDGRVRVAKYERRGFGNYLIVRHTNGLETIYGHLDESLVKEGDIVRAGDPIGLGGNTGRSTGPHLHLETKFMGYHINPEKIIDFGEGIPYAASYTFTKKSSHHNSYAKSSNKNNVKMYRIRRGDTLSEIASKNGTTVSKLCRLNGLRKSSKLKIGRSIRVR